MNSAGHKNINQTIQKERVRRCTLEKDGRCNVLCVLYCIFSARSCCKENYKIIIYITEFQKTFNELHLFMCDRKF